MKITKKYIQKAVEDLNFKTFTDIQEQVIPVANDHKDIIATSPTGTGKSHAFLIPVFERLEEDLHDLQVLIISPTRELATQLHNNAKHIASFCDKQIDIKLYTGGQDRAKDIEKLGHKQPQIVIGTPGKLYDLAIKANQLKVYRAKLLIIDEADMALESGFLEDIDALARTMTQSLQMMVFSATIPEALKPFLKKYLKHPVSILLADLNLEKLNITHTFVRSYDKDQSLLKITESLNPYLAIVFANKKEDVDRLGKLLYQKGLNVTTLHGDLPPRKRKQILKAINRLEFQFVVASDMVSRGLDIDGVSHIINYDLPNDMSFYIHRIGRTGRMNKTGESISLFTEKDDAAFSYLDERSIEYNIKGKRDRPNFKKPNKPTVGGPRKKLKVKPNYKKKLKEKKKW